MRDKNGRRLNSIAVPDAGEIAAGYAPLAPGGKGIQVTGDGTTTTTIQLKGKLSTIGFPTTGTWALNDRVEDASGTVWKCVIAGTPGTWRPVSYGSVDQITTNAAVQSYVTNGGTAVTLSTTPVTVPLASTAGFQPTGTVLFANRAAAGTTPTRVSATYTGISGNSLTGVTISSGTATVPDQTGAYYNTSGLPNGALTIASQIVASAAINGRPQDLVLVASFDPSAGHTFGDYDIVMAAQVGSYGVLSIQLPVVMPRDTEFRDGLGNKLFKFAAGPTSARNLDNPAPLTTGFIETTGTIVGNYGTNKDLRLEIGGSAGSFLFKDYDNTTDLMTFGRLGANTYATMKFNQTARMEWAAPPALGNSAQLSMNTSARFNLIAGSGGFALQNNAGSVNQFAVTANGSVALGLANMATTATDGFAFLPTVTGPPTGVPSANSSTNNYTAMVWDKTNHKLWAYDGTWKGVAFA